MTNINYTAEMVAQLEQNAPIDYAKAIELGVELGKSPKSIIAKCKREGIFECPKKKKERMRLIRSF